MASKRQSSFNKAVAYISKKNPSVLIPHQQSEFNKAVEAVKKDIVKKKTTKQPKFKNIKSGKPRPGREKKRLYRQSILKANYGDNSIKSPRLIQAGVPNAITQFPTQFNLETGNVNFGKGFTERTFYGGAKQSARTQAAAAKNILKRAKRIKRISARTLAVAGLGSIIATVINRKVTANKIPKGYKMVFGRVVKIKNYKG